jgi:hypothetical protein
MVAVIQAPIASAYDPLVSSEGSIDPLGLAGTYDRLADRLLPGVTVRMGRPRFLTAIAVGAHVCRGYEPDALASDGVTPPYQTFEWWVVEACIREWDRLSDPVGIPGALKVRTCTRNQRPVSAAAYLKTPSVFGFTGIFRRLARCTQILTHDGFLDEAGNRLLDTWSRERRLEGFAHGDAGAGPEFRRDLEKAVKHGMQDAHTSYRPGTFWGAIASHLDPARPGRAERQLLFELIGQHAGDPTHMRCLTEAIRRTGDTLAYAGEATFLRKLRRTAPASLVPLLTAIDTFESLARPLTNAFDWVRYLAARDPVRGLSATQFIEQAPAAALRTSIASAARAVNQNEIVRLAWKDADGVLPPLAALSQPGQLFEAVLRHHASAQERKPPDGKRPWLERTTQGSWLMRAGYSLDSPPAPSSEYVHEYRVPTLSRFLRDLGVLS